MDPISRPQTPPHHPIHGVRMSSEGVRELLGSIYPGAGVLSTAQLPSGRSYNNRIYNVTVDHGGLRDSSDGDQPSLGVQELVLKMNGRFFGADKIQNEVACLRLMEIHCPQVPSPRVRAWSENGVSFMRISPDGGGCQTGKQPRLGEGEHSAGWILMTRLPGDALSLGDWDESELKDVARQLAGMVAYWRLNMPAIKHCGNLLFCDEQAADLSLGRTATDEEGTLPAVMARGVIGIPGDVAHADPISSQHGHWKLRLESAIRELETKDGYIPNRALAPVLRDFIANTLPRLSLVLAPDRCENGEFVFTHLDISPRNVLVSGNPPKISGIVDYEFSGFFTAEEEFVQDEINNRGDWPAEVYEAYLARLEELGVKTPLKGTDEAPWKQLLCIARVIENIAPWWLPGDKQGEALTAALEAAEEVVRGGIRELEDHLSVKN